MQISVTMTGLDVLLQNLLRELPEALDVPTLRRALVAAGEPIRAGMEVLAPKGPDAPHLAESMIVKPLAPGELEALTDDAAGVEIGPTKGFFYGYFWEFGWSTKTGTMPARPFARPAFDSGQAPALQILEERLGAAIMQALEKPK